MTLRTFLKDTKKKLNPISDEILRDIYLEVMNKLSENYKEGSIKHILEHHKDLYDEINKSDVSINEVWQKCNDGTASIEDFKGVLDSCKALYLKCIELFKSKTENMYGNCRKKIDV